MANLLHEARNILAKLSTKPKIFGSEAYKGLKKIVDSEKSLGKTISADVRKTITDSIAQLTAMAATKTATDAYSDSKARQSSSFSQKQLDDIMKIMYNQGEDGIAQEGSTTINKGSEGSKGGG